MNPIQKYWLKFLEPVAFLINEKLAKRSGFFGKIGKFFIIGPREYGSHPINKMFIYLNRRYMGVSALLLHRYSVLKVLTHNGFHMIRIFKHISFIGPLTVFIGLLRFVYFTPENRGYTPDRFPYIERKIGNRLALPLNTLNQRTSAHYIEINYIYGAEMVKRYHNTYTKLVEDRAKCTDQEKRSRYADPSYKFIPTKQVFINGQLPLP